MTHELADLELALAAVAEAGEAVMRWFGTELEVMHKGPDQPVTAADLEADALLRKRLIGERPAYGWLSEETADHPGRLARERVWIVDPIDGTNSFIAHRPEFSISVGLAERGHVIVGVVCNPAKREVFWAVRGAGAWLRTAEQGDRRLHALEPAVTGTILASRAELRRGEFAPFEGDWRMVPTGSTAYKLAKVAAGDGSAFLSRGPKSEWDVCAGALIVDEAGGVASDLTGRALAFNRPDPYVHGILAASPAAHARLLQTLATLPPTGRLRGEEDE